MVGKSKVISGLNDWQAHRRRKDTIMGSSVGPDAYAQTREPKGTIGELFVPTFHAGLTNNDSAKTPGGNFLEATVVRGTSATYVDRNGILQLAGPNESRQEYANGQPLGTLMEPPSTNKCKNYNANPDIGLTNLSTSGDPAGVISRVDDRAELAAAGLNATVTEGFVVKLDNSGGSGVFEAFVEGSAGNTNAYQCSIYWRGTGQGRLRTTGTAGVAVPLPSTYEYYSVSETPAAGTNRLRITAQAGAVLYFILNQFEEQPVATSTIITSGAAASRDVDQLSWPLDSILNQSEGMLAFLWRPAFAASDIPGAGDRRINLVDLNVAGSGIVNFQVDPSDNNRFRSWDGVSQVVQNVAGGIVANGLYLVALVWSGSTRELAYKFAGNWETEAGGYIGAFPDDGLLRLNIFSAAELQLPSHYRNLYVWDKNRGIAWLQSFFEGVAN